MRNQLVDPRLLPPGTVIKVRIQGLFSLYWHYGVVSDLCDKWGIPLVFSNSWANGRGAEETLEMFAQGQICIIVGYPSDLPPDQVVANARRLLSKPYNLMFWDCQHFANACHKLPPSVGQAGMTLLAAFAAAVLLTARD